MTRVREPSAAIRSSSATTSVRACTALVLADSLTKSTRCAPAARRQRDQAGHDAPTQDVVAQLRPVGLDPHLEVARVLDQLQEPGEGCTSPTGSFGLPARSPVTKMNSTGNTVATKR